MLRTQFTETHCLHHIMPESDRLFILRFMKQMIVGLDLSFNSTGIAISYLEDWKAKYVTLHRLVFDDESRKTENWQPKPIINVVQEVYRMPRNIDRSQFSINKDPDDFSTEQITATLKAMVCAKRISKILDKQLSEYQPDAVFFNIEGAITPMFSTANQMRVIAELTVLQGYVREWIVRNYINKEYSNYVLHITPPNQLKRFFTGNGKADKDRMYQSFIENWDGIKLMPLRTNSKIDDVVDAFALMCFMYNQLISAGQITL